MTCYMVVLHNLNTPRAPYTLPFLEGRLSFGWNTSLLGEKIAKTVHFQGLAAKARARRGKAAPGLRQDNGKDNDVQKKNILILFKNLIVLVIVLSAKLQKPSRKLPKWSSNL